MYTMVTNDAGSKGIPRFFEETIALEAYDLTGDQVCRLLEVPNPTNSSKLQLDIF